MRLTEAWQSTGQRLTWSSLLIQYAHGQNSAVRRLRAVSAFPSGILPRLRKTAFSANVSARPRLQHRTCSPPSFCNSPLAVPFSDDQLIKSCAADRFSLFIRHLSRRPVQLTEKVRRRQNTGCIGKNPSGKPSSKAMYPLPGLSAPLSKTSVLQKYREKDLFRYSGQTEPRLIFDSDFHTGSQKTH